MLREVKESASGHTANKEQSIDSNPGSQAQLSDGIERAEPVGTREVVGILQHRILLLSFQRSACASVRNSEALAPGRLTQESQFWSRSPTWPRADPPWSSVPCPLNGENTLYQHATQNTRTCSPHGLWSAFSHQDDGSLVLIDWRIRQT